MASNIVATKLPRAIAREKDGIVLYWSEDLQREGLSQRGLARLLECNPKTVSAVWDGVTQSSVFEAEVITEGGLQAIKLICGESLTSLLAQIAVSKVAQETKNRAYDLHSKLVQMGYPPGSANQAVRKRVRNKRQSVYIVRCTNTGVFKIGISNNPLRRVADIQTGYPYKLALARVINCSFAKEVEQGLHRSLADFRLNGEWFDGFGYQMIGEAP